jgi:hypothetical protein
MKRLFASLLSLSLIILSCNTLQPTPTPAPTDESFSNPLNTPWDDRSIFKSGLVQSEQPVLDKLSGASIYHLDIHIADDLYHVTGTEEVRYTNAETIPLDKVEFRLFPNLLAGKMKISNLSVDGQSIKPKYDLNDSLMIVPLSKSLDPNQSIILKMDYAVTVPQRVDLSYGVLAYYEDVLALAHAYPMICVYDDEGWNAEIPSPQGDITYADASFYIVRVTAPTGVTLVTSGSEISRDEAGQLQTLNVASGPARDFYLAASPNYEEQSQTMGEVTIHSYAPRDLHAGSQFVLQTAANALKDYSERYAPYPYTELDVVATPNSALGIEYPGMIAITTHAYIVNQENPAVNGVLEGTVAHEVGHQWFYNLVGDDQLDDPWLDESLTQFVTLQYYSDLYGVGGEQGFRASLEGRWAGVGNADIPIGMPVAKYRGSEYSGIVYGRGPLFFVALRDKIGKEAFDSFIKDYTTTYSWSIATPQGMQSLAEKHCGCDLQPIFDEWVYPK